MKKRKIDDSQIETVLQNVYLTNISAQTFDALKKLLLELPELDELTKADEP